MTIETELNALLVNAIREWMEVEHEHMQYHHGKAQGIARAISVVRATDFTTEWENGLNGYQNWVVCGDDA